MARRRAFFAMACLCAARAAAGRGGAAPASATAADEAPFYRRAVARALRRYAAWGWVFDGTAPAPRRRDAYDGRIWPVADGVLPFWDAHWKDDGFFHPPDHDPRRGLNLTERRLEENSCPEDVKDGICCSLCKNDLVYCPKLAGYLVEDKYYPSEASVTGSCDDIDLRASVLDVFGPAKTFRDNDHCRSMVREYVCLWWGTESDAYENRCKEKGETLVPPCRSYCTQVAIQCANNLEYEQICKRIPCPPVEEVCTPGPYEAVGLKGCNVYRYNSMEQPWYTGAKGGAAPGFLLLLALAASAALLS